MKKFFAFTLAEVLITLGVIGVVAALTIPAVISNYEKKVIEEGFKKTYSDLYNLIKRSEADNGTYEEWDYTLSSANFVAKYFAPYINLTECKGKSMPCFTNDGRTFNVWRYPGEKECTLGGNYKVSPKYLLDDGRSMMVMVRHTPMYSGYWSYVVFVVDVNGQKGHSVMGEDVFVFSLSNYLRYGDRGKPIKGFHVGGSENDGDFSATTESIRNNWCKVGNNMGTHKCGLLIQRNGWKFPKDYPIKF